MTEFVHSLASGSGLLGDALTCAGALYIALRAEAKEEERHLLKHGAMETYRATKGFAGLPVEIEDYPIDSEADIEIAVARSFANRVRQGAGILAAGFVFLLISRILEML